MGFMWVSWQVFQDQLFSGLVKFLRSLEATSGKAVKINPKAAQQLALFPETNPLLDELKELDLNALSPIEALNKLYEWQRKFRKD